jgi:hypothetical protein
MGTDLVPEYGDFKQEAWIDFLGSPTLVSASHTAPVTAIVIEPVSGETNDADTPPTLLLSRNPWGSFTATVRDTDAAQTKTL